MIVTENRFKQIICARINQAFFEINGTIAVITHWLEYIMEWANDSEKISLKQIAEYTLLATVYAQHQSSQQKWVKYSKKKIMSKTKAKIN